MKRYTAGLLPVLVLLPTLAQAYAGVSPSGWEVAVFLLLLATPFVLPPVLVLLAYRRPQHKTLQLLQGLALLLHTWVWWYLSSSGQVRQWGGYWMFVYLESLLPLALVLNGLAQAHLASHELIRLLWVGAAVVGGRQLLWELLRLLGPARFELFGSGHPALYQAWFLLLGGGMALLCWVLVVRRLRRQPEVSIALWQQPWWRAPLLAGVIGGVYTLVTELSYTLFAAHISINWPSLAWGMLTNLLVIGAAGVVALRLVSPLVAALELPDEYQTDE